MLPEQLGIIPWKNTGKASCLFFPTWRIAFVSFLPSDRRKFVVILIEDEINLNLGFSH